MSDLTASYIGGGYSLQQGYDANGMRVKKTENGLTTYYLRSSVFGGQVMAEITFSGSTWNWSRGYVYSGSGLLAVQSGGASWVHEDPITKSKRITNSSGTVISSIELDPWGADAGAAWSSNSAFQPRKFTTYDRDGNGSDEAMFRRHNRWHSRFDQPDPYDGSYDLAKPQSFNRYAYVQNDPVNFVDPSGLDPQDPLTPPTTPAIDPATGRPHPGGLPGPVESVDVNIGRGERSGGAVGASSGPIEVETPGGPTEAELVPQNPTPTPTPCPGSIPEAAAIQILAIAAQEGVDPTLLSVTWRHESSFTGDPPPNPRYEGRGRNRREELCGSPMGKEEVRTLLR